MNQEKLDKQNKLIQEFVEKTRRYDTWEWKTIYEDEMAHELTLLFDSVGCTGYIKMLYEKLKEKVYNYFFFNDLEKMLIENKKEHVKEKLKNYTNKIVYKNISGLKAGIVFIDYEYRNDLAEYIREQKIDIDFVMLIALDYGTISYRNIKENVNVRKIAEGFGGKGHDKAASSPISKEQQKEIQNILISKKEK